MNKVLKILLAVILGVIAFFLIVQVLVFLFLVSQNVS